ncbi:MAG TPA: hypothetical protein DIS78_09485 [Lachnospiraceae bacterium]|nr:hypothetical protein [Lachnospiraceae bacterium]
MIRVFSIVCSCAGRDGATARFSDMAADRLKERAAQAGETVEYECITADTVNLSFCRSCNSCFKKGSCPLDSVDDMPKIKEKLICADVIFFCSPVYMGTMSGFAKSLIDRIAYYAHRFEFAGKTAAVLVTTSTNHGSETVNDIKKMLQFMGASVAYAGCAYRHEGEPNIHLPQEMAPELSRLSESVLESLNAPEKYIEEWQELSFIHRNRMNKKSARLLEIAKIQLPDEARVCIERGYGNFKTLTDYVLSMRGGEKE